MSILGRVVWAGLYLCGAAESTIRQQVAGALDMTMEDGDTLFVSGLKQAIAAGQTKDKFFADAKWGYETQQKFAGVVPPYLLPRSLQIFEEELTQRLLQVDFDHGWS